MDIASSPLVHDIIYYGLLPPLIFEAGFTVAHDSPRRRKLQRKRRLPPVPPRLDEVDHRCLVALGPPRRAARREGVERTKVRTAGSLAERRVPRLVGLVGPRARVEQQRDDRKSPRLAVSISGARPPPATAVASAPAASSARAVSSLPPVVSA